MTTKNKSLYDGLLLVHKPTGITSHDLVDRARKIFNTREVGHSGTLDPLASGLMILLLGQGTKLSPYIMDGDKSYSVEVLLGLKTDALDVTGKTIAKVDVTNQHLSQLDSVLPKFEGDFQWPVPMHSAVKVNGQKLYELAHKDQRIETPVKHMKFWNVKKTSDSSRESFWVDLDCSKGSFIRTWVDQLGDLLGCGACMKSLIRTQSSPFRLDQAMTLEQIDSTLKNKQSLKCFIEMHEAMPYMKRARIQNYDQTLLLNGQISHDLRRLLISRVEPQISSMIQILSSKTGELLALIAYEQGVGFKIMRVIATPAQNPKI